MIDKESEQIISLHQARNYFTPRKHIRTINRYVFEGVMIFNGKRFRLESYKEGGRRHTSVEAVQRFIEMTGRRGE